MNFKQTTLTVMLMVATLSLAAGDVMQSANAYPSHTETTTTVFVAESRAEIVTMDHGGDCSDYNDPDWHVCY